MTWDDKSGGNGEHYFEYNHAPKHAEYKEPAPYAPEPAPYAPEPAPYAPEPAPYAPEPAPYAPEPAPYVPVYQWIKETGEVIRNKTSRWLKVLSFVICCSLVLRVHQDMGFKSLLKTV